MIDVTRMQKIATLSHEPLWRPSTHLFATTIPDDIAGWLFDPSSLTARIMAACAGRFRVEVVSQHWQRAYRNEMQRLGVSAQQIALVREVYLYCNDIPWVFARTVIPRRTLSGEQKHLACLGSRPLGAVLFADPHMHRDPIEVACLTAQHRLYGKATARLSVVPAQIWGRRSVFYLANKPLLVNEIFLPTMPPCGSATAVND
jgi:chorismate--pyruvate lyase